MQYLFPVPMKFTRFNDEKRIVWALTNTEMCISFWVRERRCNKKESTKWICVACAGSFETAWINATENGKAALPAGGRGRGRSQHQKRQRLHQPNQTQRRHHHRRRHSHRHRRGVLQLNSTRQTTEADIKYTPRCAAGGIGHAACRDLALTIYSLVTRLNFTWQAEGNTGASF